jgi:hypothetical protein
VPKTDHNICLQEKKPAFDKNLIKIDENGDRSIGLRVRSVNFRHFQTTSKKEATDCSKNNRWLVLPEPDIGKVPEYTFLTG